MKRLTDIINNRKVAILLPGASLNGAEIEDGFCFATVNHYWLLEDFGIQFDVVLASAVENIPDIEKYKEFIQREGVVFLTTDLLDGGNVIHFKTDLPNVVRKVPTKEEPLTFRALASFALLILLLTIAGAKEIHLYGADGGQIPDKPLYFKDWPSDSLGRIMMDTRILNQAFPIILERVCQLYQVEIPLIINHSSGSYYTCFTKK